MVVVFSKSGVVGGAREVHPPPGAGDEAYQPRHRALQLARADPGRPERLADGVVEEAAGVFGSGEDFFAFLRDSFDVLYEEGAERPRMMSGAPIRGWLSSPLPVKPGCSRV